MQRAAATTDGVKQTKQKQEWMVGLKVLRRGRETLSTVVRIHRVIHYVCNCFIVSGHFTRRREAGELHRSDFFLDAATTVRQRQILKGYLNPNVLTVTASVTPSCVSHQEKAHMKNTTLSVYHAMVHFPSYDAQLAFGSDDQKPK